MPRNRNNDRMHVRVRTAKKRSASSARWLERQLNDPYVAAAQRDGYVSRSAYKLKEINERYNFIKKDSVVIDLGAAPGGWVQVAAQQTQNKIIAIDLLPLEATAANLVALQMDFLTETASTQIHTHCDTADVVLSDMAAATTGHRQTDHLRTIALAEAAADFAIATLTEGGTFCAKVFQGGSSQDLLTLLKRHFAQVNHIKPKASRKESSELYVVARGLRSAHTVGYAKKES